MKKWTLLAFLLIFAGALVVRSLRKKRERSVVALSKDIQFVVTDLIAGTGAEAVAGKVVFVHYVGKLLDGRVFDSSLERGDPFHFILGVGQVIAGWDKGVVGMRVGGKRRLLIPPTLGYGKRGAGSAIPPNAALDFEVELLEVR